MMKKMQVVIRDDELGGSSSLEQTRPKNMRKKSSHSPSRIVKQSNSQLRRGHSRSVGRGVSSVKGKHLDEITIFGTSQKFPEGTLMKLTPSTTHNNRDMLYQDIVQMKKDINSTKQTNVKLKTELAKTNRELEKQASRIRELTELLHRPYSSCQSTKSCLKITTKTPSLKKQIVEIRKENKLMQEEIENLKAILKTTQIQEFEKVTPFCTLEGTQCKQLIESRASPPSRQSKFNFALDSVKNEKSELLNTIKKQEKELKDKSEKVVREESEVSNQKKVIKEQAEAISKLKEEVNRLSEIPLHESDIEELQKSKLFLSTKLAEKEDRIRDLELKLVDITRTKDMEIHKLKQCLVQDRPVMESQELLPIGREIRLRLILANIPKINVQAILFDKFKKAEISIKELGGVFSYPPLALPLEKAHKLARYLIEPRNQERIIYSEERKDSIEEVMTWLNLIIQDGLTLDESLISKTQEAIVTKLKSRMPEFIEELKKRENETEFTSANLGLVRFVKPQLKLENKSAGFVSVH